MGAWFSILAPGALLGGFAALAWRALAGTRHEFPLAVLAVPLLQLAVALPFALNASTDGKTDASAGARRENG